MFFTRLIRSKYSSRNVSKLNLGPTSNLLNPPRDFQRQFNPLAPYRRARPPAYLALLLGLI